MDAIALLTNRIVGVNGGLRGLVEDLRDADWVKPVAPGTSPIGLTLWHVPRTQDWLVQTSIRGVPEVADGPSYGGLPDPDLYGFGTALTPEQAKEVASGVDPAALLTYADAVRDSVVEWLASLTEADLDEPVAGFDERQRSTRPAYSTPDALKEISHLGVLPLGQLLLRPAIAHLLMHLGEIEVLGQLATARD
jgi:hypothetical protein